MYIESPEHLDKHPGNDMISDCFIGTGHLKKIKHTVIECAKTYVARMGWKGNGSRKSTGVSRCNHALQNSGCNYNLGSTTHTVHG
jgi:hypothetical protein